MVIRKIRQTQCNARNDTGKWRQISFTLSTASELLVLSLTLLFPFTFLTDTASSLGYVLLVIMSLYSIWDPKAWARPSYCSTNGCANFSRCNIRSIPQQMSGLKATEGKALLKQTSSWRDWERNKSTFSFSIFHTFHFLPYGSLIYHLEHIWLSQLWSYQCLFFTLSVTYMAAQDTIKEKTRKHYQQRALQEISLISQPRNHR